MEKALNILVVEDSADDLFLLEQAFKKAGVSDRLHAVSEGHEAQMYLKGERAYSDRSIYPWPDLILLDLNMPRVNGFEFLTWLRQQPEFGSMIVHVLTASCRAEDVKRAYDLRANSFVVKPSRVDELIAFVGALHTWHGFVCASSQPASQTHNLKSHSQPVPSAANGRP